MKKYFLVTIILLTISLAVIGFFQRTGHQTGQGFAVIELFTSEGCSSCPPADEAVAEISKQYKTNVFVLGYHVDYWNHLGWNDQFSNSAFSNRQRKYAALLKVNSVYTPQIVVNGKIEFVGSDRNKLRATIVRELKSEMTSPFDVSAKSSDGKNVVVAVRSADNSNEMIDVALVQLEAQSDVKSGENNGKQLHHINIVRDLKTLEASARQQLVNFILPAGLAGKDFVVIAFSQNKNSWQIDNATLADIQ